MEDQINNIVNKHKGSQETLKVSYLLSQLDFSSLVQDNHKSLFSLHTIARLCIFRKFKGLSNYISLTEYLLNHEEESFQLGFYKGEDNKLIIPSKRTYNNYFVSLLNKSELEKIAERILAIATQNNVLLDLEIVNTVLKEKKKNYDREIRESIKLLRKLVYPQIDLKIKSNGKFTGKDLLDVLAHVAYTNNFANGGAKTFKVSNDLEQSPSGDLMFYHFSKFDSIDKIRVMFDKISDFVFNFAKSNYNALKNRKHDIAYDIHRIPYYGGGISYVRGGEHENGTNTFIDFLTCSIVTPGGRFIVDVVPVSPLDDVWKLLDKSLSKVKNRLRIDLAYLDRGFNEVKVFQVFKKHKVKFLMPMTKNASVKKALDKAMHCQARVFSGFKVGEEDVTLILVDAENGVKHAFVSNFPVHPTLAWRLYQLYGSRWGIETCYRTLDYDFQPRTTTRNYHIRLFYFLFSTCVFNLWVLVNICISLIIHGKLSPKPIITAKMFALLLYKVKEIIDSGG